MADSAAADAEREPAADSSPREEPKADTGTGATPGAPGGVGAMAVQAKGAVGKADDPLEREADAMAQRVMRMTDPPPVAGGETGGAPATTPAGPAPPAPAPATPDTTGAVRRQAAPTADVAPAPPLTTDGGDLPQSVHDYLASSKGGGRPLPEATRAYFESRLGTQLGDVNVHDDPGANDAARALGAVAFTRGTDIYFGAGMYDPTSEQGRTVLAHELAHVLQQTGRPASGPAAPAAPDPAAPPVTPDHPDVVRRQTGGPAAPAAPAGGGASGSCAAAPEPNPPTTPNSPTAWKTAKGRVDVAGKRVDIATLTVPQMKAPFTPAGTPVRNEERGNSDTHRKNWEDHVKGDVDTAVDTFLENQLKLPNRSAQKGKDVLFVRHDKGSKEGLIIGTRAAIKERARRPVWTKAGARKPFDVDHKREWQVCGSDDIGNLWLLDASVNRSVGSILGRRINAVIRDLLSETAPKLDPKPPDYEVVRRQWKIYATKIVPGGGAASAESWEATDVKSDAVTKPLELVPDDDLAKYTGAPNRFLVYADKTGGAAKEITDPANPNWKVDKAFEVNSISNIVEDKGATANVTLHKGSEAMAKGEYPALKIQPIPGVKYGGYLDVTTGITNMIFKRFSPVTLKDARFDLAKGIVGNAVIPSPDVPLLRDVEIGVRLSGADVDAYALIQAGALKLPGPFKVTGGSLELSAGTSGVAIDGEVSFEISKLATGRIFGKAKGGNQPGFALGGELKFDTKMFTKAELCVAYENDTWSVRGELGVGPNKISGIKSATAKVAVDGENVTAEGTFESSVKGLEQGKLSFKYDPTKGMEVAGQLTLGKLPAIKGGKLDGKIAERKDGQGYSLSGGLTAEPDLPGVTGAVTGRFEDGAFLVEADLGYQRGMLNGRVKIGITNQAVDPVSRRPAGPPTPETLVYGGGQVTIKIAPWLQGTIGLELKPNGEMVVTGKVGLPSELKVIDERKLDKTIFSIGIDIPIVGVAVLGQRIGIFANITGGLKAEAGFGPGVLRALALEVTYNPDREADTKVAGTAELYVPARAGLVLFVEGSLGAGIPVVSAKAGIRVSGGLGLEGAASAGVSVAWTPSTGLVLDAKGEIFVEPKFKFAITGFVDVSADLWIDTIELYHKEWKLAAFEYGSNIRFGVIFPIHYEEGKPFELSLSQVQFVYPDIDAGQLLKGLVSQIA